MLCSRHTSPIYHTIIIHTIIIIVGIVIITLIVIIVNTIILVVSTIIIVIDTASTSDRRVSFKVWPSPHLRSSPGSSSAWASRGASQSAREDCGAQ